MECLISSSSSLFLDPRRSYLHIIARSSSRTPPNTDSWSLSDDQRIRIQQNPTLGQHQILEFHTHTHTHNNGIVSLYVCRDARAFAGKNDEIGILYLSLSTSCSAYRQSRGKEGILFERSATILLTAVRNGRYKPWNEMMKRPL